MLNADNKYPHIVSRCLCRADIATSPRPASKHFTYDYQIFTVAPMMEAVKYEQVQFENAFHQKSKYRGTPTPELEQAWLDLWNCEFFALQQSTLICP